MTCLGLEPTILRKMKTQVYIYQRVITKSSSRSAAANTCARDCQVSRAHEML